MSDNHNSQNQMNIQHQIGSISERGLIRDLDKRGFSKFQCLCELFANSIDAKATNITYKITEELFYFIDNGTGLDTIKLENMWSLFKENHTNEKSMGISGLGAKAATKLLSENGIVILQTCNKTNNGEYQYIKVIIDWTKIVNESVYTNNINMESMNSCEIEQFKQFITGTGTVISLPRTQETHEIIVSNFTNNKKKLKHHERCGIILGKFNNVTISLDDDTDPTSNSTLELYDYFCEDNLKYYKGKKTDIIQVYENPTGSKYYYWEKEEDEYYSVLPAGRGYSKSVSRTNISPSEINVGKFMNYI